MSRRFLIPIVALAALVVLGSAGAYVYFFSGLRTSPPTLALASPSPTASATAAAPSNLGTWEITSGSLVGYRVKEQFAGQTSTHEAVARTGDVAGQVTITQNGSSYEMTALPAGVESGQQVDVTVPGQLTVHGVTKSVTATLQLRVTGNTAQIAGSIAAKMTDFGVNPPQVPFTVVQPDVTIEVSLKLTPGE